MLFLGRGCRFLIVLVLSADLATAEPLYDAFDQIRASNTAAQFSQEEGSNSNVAKISANSTEYRLVNVAAFMPFNNGEVIRTVPEAAVFLLAIHHFNNKQLSPILSNRKFFPCNLGDDENGQAECVSRFEKLGNCNVRLTTDFYDDQHDEVKSTSQISDLLERPAGNLTSPRPSAILGAYRSSITSPLAILSALDQVAQVSPASTSANLDDEEVYPFFARTCPSSDGEASAILDYYVQLGVSRVSVLYLSDAFGSALQRNFEEQASAIGMQTVYTGYVGTEDIPLAIQQIKDSKHQHVFVITLTDYETIMEAAYKAGIANGEHAWLFYGENEFGIQDAAVYEIGSPLYEASKGVAIISLSGTPQTSIQHPGQRKQDPLPSELTTANELFRSLWKSVPSDDAFLQYLQKKVPSNVRMPEEVYPDLLHVWAYFLYDAVTAVGIAMCQTEEEFFDGEDLIGEFGNVVFEGVSGHVQFNDVNTRQHTTVKFMVWNLIPASAKENTEEGLGRFLLSPSAVYTEGRWGQIHPFVYADGRTVPPADLAAVEASVDTINDPIRYIGFALSGAIMASACFACAWALWFARTEIVVRASQSSFLVLVAAGAFFQASSILPLSFDHTGEHDSERYDKACMAVPWLYYIGLSLTCGAFYAKTYRIFEVYRVPELDRLLVKKRDLLFWSSAVLGANAIMLAVWTVLSPLRYEVVPDGSVDVFGRALSSFGACRSREENEDPNGFWLSLLLANVCALCVANWFSYRARAVQTEYQESQYVAFALGTMIEALVIGSAMQHATRDLPDANYVITVGSIFLTSFVTAALMFVPKMLALRSEKREKKTQPSGTSKQQNQPPSQEPSGDGSSGDYNNSSDFSLGESQPAQEEGQSTTGAVGIRVLHHPALASGGFAPDNGIGARRALQLGSNNQAPSERNGAGSVGPSERQNSF